MELLDIRYSSEIDYTINIASITYNNTLKRDKTLYNLYNSTPNLMI